MDNDDQQVGRVLGRREVLALLGLTGAGAAALGARGLLPVPAATAATSAAAAAQLPACVVRPEATEGPYYVDLDLLRSDIRSDPATGAIKEGAPLSMTFRVLQVSGQPDGAACSPLAGAEVEVWHCDAAGAYSAVVDPRLDTTGQQFLRGSQLTDAEGVATFTTIYPGWYSGRAVHIHFKVRPDAGSMFTSQLFFDDTVSDRVFAQQPYAARGRRNTLNRTDGIYRNELLFEVTESAEGYAATFPIGIDLSALGSGSSAAGGGRNGAPPPGGRRPGPAR